jgi:hypothetical protein
MAQISGTDAAQVSHARRPAAVLTHALTSLLITDVAIAATGLIVPMISHDDYSFQLEMELKPVVILWRIALAITVVVFLIWFYRARISAERSDWPQRRARGWAFWGWVVPIADLWVPYQVMRDIWRACLPPRRRARVPWLPAVWWASWLLTGLLSHSWGTAHSQQAGYGLSLPSSWTSFSILSIAGVSLIVISQMVARDHHDAPHLV